MPARDYLEEWRQRVSPSINRRGRKNDLAEFLVENIGGTFRSHRMRLSRVFPDPNRKQKPRQGSQSSDLSAVFVWAVEDWIQRRGFDSAGLKKNI